MPSEKINKYERIAVELKALAHPTRMQILEEMAKAGKLSPNELTNIIEPRVSLGTIAHHTRKLHTSGLLRKAGTRPVRGAVEHFYELTPRGRKLYEDHIL